MRIVATALAALAASMSATPAVAQEAAGLAGQLVSGELDTVQAAIDKLGASRDPAALVILDALDERRLRIGADGKPYVKDEASGGVLDPATGRPVQAPADLTTPRITNTLRRALTAAVAQQRLRASDRDVRMHAADVLAKSPAPELVGTMRAALQGEKDDGVRERLSIALAQVDLSADDPKLRLAAVETIGRLQELSLKPQLERMLEKGSDGSYTEPDAAVRAAADRAVIAIRGKELLVRIVRDLFYGISLGSVLLLAALGLAITFGLMGVINMAHGEMIMLGAYSTFVVQTFFQKHAPGAIGWYLPAAIPVAFVVCTLVGILLERTVIRFLYGRPLETLLATWGISLVLIQCVRLVFGAANVTVANPDWLSGGWELVPGVVLPYTRLAAILFSLVIVTFVWYVLARTPLGLQVRAVTQNRRMARCVGIRSARVDMLTFGLGSGIAGLGGVALSQIGNVGPELGQGYIVDSFMVVVVGGVGKIVGTVVAAFGLGTVNKVLEPVSGAVLGKIFVLAFVILFIQRRPQGLFAQKGRAAET